MKLLTTHVCRRCSNYNFILYINTGFNGLGEDNCNARQETFTFQYLVHFILEIWRKYKSYVTTGWWDIHSVVDILILDENKTMKW